MIGAFPHIAVVLLLIPFVLSAQPSADSVLIDSARVYTVPEIIVEAGSIVEQAARSTQPVSIITRARIEAINAVDLSDVVAHAPGVFIRQYGGVGGLRTVSLRGTGAQQIVLLIDGVRYQNSSNGGIDMSNIPASALERVEIVRGGDAAMYGANSLGGAINIVTDAARGEPFWGRGRVGIGSFGEWGISADAGGGDDRHSWDVGVHSTRAAGDYPFTYSEFGSTSTIHRENADFSNLFGRAGWAYRGEQGLRVSLRAQGVASNRGTPGAIVQGNREQLRARLNERDLFLVGHVSSATAEWQWTVAASGRLNRLDYSDPDALSAGAGGIDNRYDRSEQMGTIALRRSIGTVGVIEVGGEISYAALRGDNLDPSVGSAVDRLQAGCRLSTNWLLDSLPGGSQLALDVGLRVDYFSDLDVALGPSVGVAWRVGRTPLRLRAHTSLNYRAPSFSEQYYLNYGNADLRPERSASFDLGATYELTPEFALESGAFLIDTRDQIVSVPRSPVSWSAMNVGRVSSRGVEVSAYGSLLDGRLDARLSYTFMMATDRGEGATDGNDLVYSPRELFNGLCETRFDRYGIGVSWQAVSHRYSLPSNAFETALPRYWVVGANLSGRWPFGSVEAIVRIEGTNLFGAEYQVIRNYPMPGRSFKIGVEIRYRQAR